MRHVKRGERDCHVGRRFGVVWGCVTEGEGFFVEDLDRSSSLGGGEGGFDLAGEILALLID